MGKRIGSTREQIFILRPDINSSKYLTSKVIRIKLSKVNLIGKYNFIGKYRHTVILIFIFIHAEIEE